MKTVKVIETNRIYSGKVSIRKDKFLLEGKKVEKEIVEHQDSIGIVPVIDTESIILVTQYRHAVGKTLLEIPAGKIEEGETPEKAAVREMAEEIGYSGEIERLQECYLAPGYSTELMHLFVATNLKHTKRGILDDDENIRIRKMKLSTAVKKCLDGNIKDSKTIAALLAYYSRSK